MPCCAASTIKMQNRVAAALQQPYKELKARLAHEPQLFMDESPTKQVKRDDSSCTKSCTLSSKFRCFPRLDAGDRRTQEGNIA